MADGAVPFWYVFDINDIPPGYTYQKSTDRAGRVHYKVHAPGAVDPFAGKEGVTALVNQVRGQELKEEEESNGQNP